MPVRKPVNVFDVLRGCTKQWLKIIRDDDMYVELQTVLDHTTVRPYTPSDMFAFARYSMANVKAVILATEPYDNGQADGLAYSATGECPTSLAGIWAALVANGLIRSVPVQTDLSYLAAQGVVLINCALTVEPGRPGSHIKLWQPWIDRVIGRLGRDLPDQTIWCLWGDTQRKADLIDQRHTVLKWSHPRSPDFAACDHFKQISNKFPLVWDPRNTETHFYTDGAAKGNQYKSTRAAWGVACTRGLMAGREWGGELVTVTIVGPVPKKSKTGVCNEHRMRADGLADVEARPTNIRAEGAALIRAMKLALSLPVRSVIHTDSKLWIHDMLGIDNARQGYIPNWVERGSKWSSHANADLCEEMWLTYQRAATHGVQFQFVRCWHDRPRPADGTTDLAWWLGNRAAEEAAERALV